jgi:hypothetical protein
LVGVEAKLATANVAEGWPAARVEALLKPVGVTEPRKDIPHRIADRKAIKIIRIQSPTPHGCEWLNGEKRKSAKHCFARSVITRDVEA